VASPEKIEEMRRNLLAGGYGWGHAKKDLLDAILERFSKERELFNHYMENTDELDTLLKAGAEKASIVANDVLKRVREKVGF